VRRIVCLLGSPRPKGNSAAMATALCRGAAAAGAEVAVHPLNNLSYRGCQGCLCCKTKAEACVLEDDLSPVLAAVAACDALVLATPVYFGEVSAQLKAFIDRTYGFLTPDYAHSKEHRTRLASGKTLCFVIAQGHPRADLFADIFPRYAYFFNWLGFTHARVLRQCGLLKAGEAQTQKGLLNRAGTLGRELALGQGEPDWLPPPRKAEASGS